VIWLLCHRTMKLLIKMRSFPTKTLKDARLRDLLRPASKFKFWVNLHLISHRMDRLTTISWIRTSEKRMVCI
jgi:hypothetical protein